MVTRAQRQRGLPGLASMPPQVLHAIIAASGDEHQLSAALASTCRALRTTVAELCTTLHLRQFGSAQQVTSLLQRCKGVHALLLEGVGAAAAPWPDIAALQHLRRLTLPLAAAASQLRPLSTLQQLTALAFTKCQYGEGDLPTAALACLMRLVQLEALGCAPLDAPGPELAALQQLEVLHLPCSDPVQYTALAAKFPKLRSLSLRCCVNLPSVEGRSGVLGLPWAALTALTELRLTVTPDAMGTVEKLQLVPSGIKELHLEVDAGFQQTVNAFSCPVIGSTANAVVDVLNVLPLERLASLVVSGCICEDHREPTQLRLPATAPPLTSLAFARTANLELLEASLWPLVQLAAREHMSHAGSCSTIRNTPAAGASTVSAAAVNIRAAIPERNADGTIIPGSGFFSCQAWEEAQARMAARAEPGWRLQLAAGGFRWQLTAVDILRATHLTEDDSDATAAMRSSMSAAEFHDEDEVAYIYQGEDWSSVMDLVEYEGGLTRLVVGEPTAMYVHLREPSFNQGRSIAQLTDLRHLAMADLAPLEHADCIALQGLSLTHLDMPETTKLTRRDITIGLSGSIGSLRELRVDFSLTPNTMVMLQLLPALTALQLRTHETSFYAVEPFTARGWAKLRGTAPLKLRRLEIRRTNARDAPVAASLAFMPQLQELVISNEVIDGSCLAALARHCPRLRRLRLDRLDFLKFTPSTAAPLRRLQDLTVLEICDVQLNPTYLAALGRSLPPHLQTLLLHCRHVMYNEEPVGAVTDEGVAAFLDALPTPSPPLRRVALYADPGHPLTDVTMRALAEAGSSKLATLECLDVREFSATKKGLLRLKRLPALVQLRTNTFDYMFRDGGRSLDGQLAALQAAVLAQGRHLKVGVCNLRCDCVGDYADDDLHPCVTRA